MLRKILNLSLLQIIFFCQILFALRPSSLNDLKHGALFVRTSSGKIRHAENDDSRLSEVKWDPKISSAIKLTASTATVFVLSTLMNIQSYDGIQGLQISMKPMSACARNLPTSNGASGANRGEASTLVPIIQMRNNVELAIAQMANLQECETLLSKIPLIEKDFKKLFDEHSEGISYKQQFLDQNAFLVYYTKGFDGPGRPSIEEEDSNSLKEKGQFGARNDAWVAVDEARAEIRYLLEFRTEKINTKDLKKLLKTASKAFSDYLSYDPVEIVKNAEILVSKLIPK